MQLDEIAFRIANEVPSCEPDYDFNRNITSKIASITFWSDSPIEIEELEKICACTDFSSGEGETYNQNYGRKEELQKMLESGDPEKEKIAREEAAKHADKQDIYGGGCKGTGIETTKEKPELQLNWSNSNALAMLEVLGLPPEYNGEVSMPEMKRALIRAKNRSSFERFERKEEILTRPRKIEEGVTELHAPYLYSMGLSESSIKERLESFEKLIKEAETNGAKNIVWG